MFKAKEDDLNYLSFIHLLICNGEKNLTKSYILKNLKSMKVEYNMIKGFKKFNCLEYDDLSVNDVDYLINNLHYMENTKKLILKNNKEVDDSHFKELLNSISSLTNLEGLEIISSELNDEKMKYLCNELDNFQNTLKSLNLSDNFITEQSSGDLRDSIKTLTLLEEINLNSILLYIISYLYYNINR